MFQIFEVGNESNSFINNPLQLSKSPHIVSFYRSQIQAEKKSSSYGSNDTSYNGEFGFDRFDDSVVADGMMKHYEILKEVESDEKTYKKDHSYLCPYLSLWPPNVEGNKKNTKNKAKIYVALEKSTEFKKENATQVTIDFESEDDKSVVINGKKTASLSLKLDDKHTNLPYIEVECIAEFDKEIAVLAKVSNVVIGKMILYPNKERYKALIQPVYVSLGTTTSTSKLEVPTSSISDIDEVALLDCANNHSLNQAYIYAEIASKTHKIELKKSELTDFLETRADNSKTYLYKDGKKRSDFNKKVKELYTAILAGGNIAKERVRKDEVYQSSGVQQAILNFRVELKSHFNHNFTDANRVKKAQKLSEKTELNNFWMRSDVNDSVTGSGAYDMFLAKEKSMLATLKKEGISDLDKPHQTIAIPTDRVHVFYFGGIEASYAEPIGAVNKLVPGYTGVGGGISYIFEMGFKMPDAILHEIAHGLGLGHTFEEKIEYNDKKGVRTDFFVNIDLDITEQQQKSYEGFKENDKKMFEAIEDWRKEYKQENGIDLPIEDAYLSYAKYKTLSFSYQSIVKEGEKIDATPSYDDYLLFKDFIANLQLTILSEADISNLTLDSSFLSYSKKLALIQDMDKRLSEHPQEIKDLKKELKKAPEREVNVIVHPQSDTMENYMDYDFDDTGNKQNFERKSFYKEQWEIMRKIGSKFFTLLK
ncbi:hypothetical protein [Bernardetia sp. MNP-M8]|uniref:hypothetical protein n=1 Tax=Bernardetia sp. MNP-M8 TaxID=3127470 RepID=UPI0030CFDACA